MKKQQDKRKGPREDFEPEPWGAIGDFDGSKILSAFVYMDEAGYKVTHKLITQKSELGNIANDIEFKDFTNGDFALVINLIKSSEVSDATIRLPLKDATGISGGKEFFIALHKDGNKQKYRRKSQSIVTDHKKLPGSYISNALVSLIP